MINGLIVLSVGLGLNMLAEAILFYLVFVSLRFFCGGYHADSYIKCFFSFGLTTIVCLSFSVRLAQYEELILIPFWITAVILGWHIIKMAPIEHKNRILIEDERRIFRRRSIQIYIFCFSSVSSADAFQTQKLYHLLSSQHYSPLLLTPEALLFS